MGASPGGRVRGCRPGEVSRAGAAWARRKAALGAVAMVAVAGLAACSAGGTGGAAGPGTATPGAGSTGTGAPLRLSGPGTAITVVIPAGWHQVIDSADPSVPEMVTPDSCAGSDEVSCALGLARLADLAAPSAQAAAQAVQQAVDSGAGVRAGATLSGGPGQVAGQTGYLMRFRFSNGSGTLTSGIAAVPVVTAEAGGSSTPAPSGSGSRQFAVVLVWISGKAGAPGSGIISQVIGSAALTGGLRVRRASFSSGPDRRA